MTPAEFFLRLRLAEAEVLCRECEDIIAHNASVEAQIVANEGNSYEKLHP